jgi:hypothetical protein
MLTAVFQYFSTITVTTVGFGDIVPVTPAARLATGLEAIVGQFYLAIAWRKRPASRQAAGLARLWHSAVLERSSKGEHMINERFGIVGASGSVSAGYLIEGKALLHELPLYVLDLSRVMFGSRQAYY